MCNIITFMYFVVVCGHAYISCQNVYQGSNNNPQDSTSPYKYAFANSYAWSYKFTFPMQQVNNLQGTSNAPALQQIQPQSIYSQPYTSPAYNPISTSRQQPSNFVSNHIRSGSHSIPVQTNPKSQKLLDDIRHSVYIPNDLDSSRTSSITNANPQNIYCGQQCAAGSSSIPNTPSGYHNGNGNAPQSNANIQRQQQDFWNGIQAAQQQWMAAMMAQMQNIYGSNINLGGSRTGAGNGGNLPAVNNFHQVQNTGSPSPPNGRMQYPAALAGATVASGGGHPELSATSFTFTRV